MTVEHVLHLWLKFEKNAKLTYDHSHSRQNSISHFLKRVSYLVRISDMVFQLSGVQINQRTSMQKQYICCIIVVIFSFYDNVKLKLLSTYVYELLRNKDI